MKITRHGHVQGVLRERLSLLEPSLHLLLGILQSPFAASGFAEDLLNLRLRKALCLSSRIIAQPCLLSNLSAGDWSTLLAVSTLVDGHHYCATET